MGAAATRRGFVGAPLIGVDDLVKPLVGVQNLAVDETDTRFRFVSCLGYRRTTRGLCFACRLALPVVPQPVRHLHTASVGSAQIDRHPPPGCLVDTARVELATAREAPRAGRITDHSRAGKIPLIG